MASWQVQPSTGDRSRTGRTWPEVVGSAEDTGRSGHEKADPLLCDQAPEWTSQTELSAGMS